MSPKKDDGKAKEVAYPGDPDGFMAEQKDQQKSEDAPEALDEDAAVKKIEEMTGPDAKFGAQPGQYGDEDGFGAVPAQYGNPDEVAKKAGE